jgi:hypothetical protein
MASKMAPFIFPQTRQLLFSCPSARLALSNHPHLVQKTAAQMEHTWFKTLPTDAAQNGTLFSPQTRQLLFTPSARITLRQTSATGSENCRTDGAHNNYKITFVWSIIIYRSPL